MNLIILQLAARYIKPILLIFSVFILLRGHNEPGGGFIAGLLAGSGFIFHAMAHGSEKTARAIRFKPVTFIRIGLLLIFFSAIAGIISGEAFMKSQWITINLLIGELKVGSPLLFDTGIYFTVAGVLLLITFSIMEEVQWK